MTGRQVAGVRIFACPCGAVWWPVNPHLWKLTAEPDPDCDHRGRTLRTGFIKQKEGPR